MGKTTNKHDQTMTAEAPSGSSVIHIVDPDEAHSREVSALLNRVGYITETFGSAEELLDRPGDRFTHGCIISEMDLPGMNGLKLLHTLQQRQVAMPVIILTRDNDVSLVVQAFRNSVADYLVKPFVERELVNKVRCLLQRNFLSGT